MRLIDADALFMENMRTMLEPLGNGQYEEVEIVYFRDIENAPTIDPASLIEKPVYLDTEEVAKIVMEKLGKDKSLEQLMDECFNRGYRKAIRHGKWEVVGKTTRYYICSNCGKPGDGWDNYCRSCGARMDGDDNETD